VTAVAAAGTCYGFSVASPLPFAYLRGGTGEPLEVRADGEQGSRQEDELARVWTPRPDAAWTARLYRSGDRFRVSIGDAGWFEIDPGALRIGLPDATESPIRREERLWGIPALLCFLRRGDIPLHAAVIEVDGEALLIAGPSGAGKTTLAAAFVGAGHRLLSEDLACLRRGERLAVVPGPAMLRLRTDVARRMAIAGVEVGRDEDRVHIALPEEGRGTCEPVPVRGIVLIHGEADEVELARVPPVEALRDLWALSFNLPDDADRARCFDAVAGLAERCPVWSLRRPLRFDALDATVTALAALR
jgi:hypothetical protein